MSWYHKSISAKFIDIESGNIIVLDEEDNIKFSYQSQDMSFPQYTQLKNSCQKGDKVNIKVNSVVDINTGEVIKRVSRKNWLYVSFFNK